MKLAEEKGTGSKIVTMVIIHKAQTIIGTLCCYR